MAVLGIPNEIFRKQPPFYHNEHRQVQFQGLPYLPVIPKFGTKKPITRVQNGTFIVFVKQEWIGDDPTNETEMWLFELSVEKEGVCQFYVSTDALTSLWKAKVPRHMLTNRSRY